MNELFHYSLFLVLFLAFTYNKKQPPAFGAALAFFCFLLSFLGILFCHIPYNLSTITTILLTANNAPFFYQISGTWSNHEGSILSWCRIPSFYGFLICYRCPPKRHHNVSELRILYFFIFLYYRRHSSRTKIKAVTQRKQIGLFYTPSFVIVVATATNSYEYVINSELRSRGFYRPAFLIMLTQKKKTRGSREGTHTNTLLLLIILLMARDGKERASSIEEQRIFGLGIALFFYFFLSASPDPFIRNFFVRTEPLSELNPVPQDPLSAIHPPFIYAGEVASAMGFVLCRSKMMTGIVILHSPPMRKNNKKGTLLCSAGCVDESSSRSELLFTLEFRRHVVGSSMLSRIIYNNRLCNRSLLMLLLPWRRLVLVDEQGKRSIFGSNTVVSVQDREFVKIWILICRWFLTVGILPGSWWAYHELGRGGWWFRDPVENASFMPRLLATALLHSVIIPLLNSWTSRMNLVTFLCCILGTFLIRSGLLASVHSFATDTLGIFLWWFFLIMTGISIILFSQMKQQASVHITYKKEMIYA